MKRVIEKRLKVSKRILIGNRIALNRHMNQETGLSAVNWDKEYLRLFDLVLFCENNITNLKKLLTQWVKYVIIN